MKRHQFIAALLLSSVAVLGHAQNKGPLRVGVTGFTAQEIEIAAKEAKAQGLEVKIVEFSDYTTPNTALDAGDLDFNYFQHQAFLDNAVKQRGFKIRSIAPGVHPAFSFVSTKIKRLADARTGALVGIHADAANQARALRLLEREGLVKLRPGAGHWAALADITDNPRKLKFVEVDGSQMVRSLEDFDFASTSPMILVTAGKPELANNALAYTQGDDTYYAGQFVARLDNADDPRIRQFIKIFHESPAVRKQIHASFANNDRLYSLAWLRK